MPGPDPGSGGNRNFFRINPNLQLYLLKNVKLVIPKITPI